ncbi:SRPBCC family protein [Nioella sediminis]|jgi:carbon monoxide dehydrogenase subunit G|uniref:SRPBCC family protein n=1 Tax=Nioella sediminis TaxID=1912092 RepID=UPI0008FD10FD|nr:SRPBCC family protein [Nioella sediminis]
MIRASRAIAIAAPVDTVWQALRDLGGLSAWHPAVARCEMLGTPPDRVGALRRVQTRDGLSMDEELVAMREHEHRIEIRARAMPFAVTEVWQALCVFGVVEGGGSLLLWEMRADAVAKSRAAVRDWFADGYMPAGLRGFARHIAPGAMNDFI